MFSYIFVFLLFLGCTSKKSPRKIPETSNQYLNQYLTEAPVTVLSLDHVPADTLRIRDKDILGLKRNTSLSDSAFIGGITGMVKIRNHLIPDYSLPSIRDDQGEGKIPTERPRQLSGP